MSEELANGSLGSEKKFLVVGGDDEVIENLSKHYSSKGMKVACLCVPREVTLDDCDLVISQVFWDNERVYLDPINGKNEFPNILIDRNNLSKEQVMDQVQGFLEAIGF